LSLEIATPTDRHLHANERQQQHQAHDEKTDEAAYPGALLQATAAPAFGLPTVVAIQ
jgi:hypothetical protein